MERPNKIITPELTLRIIKEIENNPEITQRDLSKKLNISLGKINFMVNALIDKGIIEAKNFKNSKNKLGYMYMMTPEGIKTKIRLAQEFFVWKLEEYERLKREIQRLIDETHAVLDEGILR